VVAGALLARLWWSGAPLTLIVGAYLLLNGLSRFVEESFRGEPQTPRAAGLAIYQWNAVASVLAGAVITALPGEPAPPPQAPGTSGLLVAAGFGLLCWAAMGLDWPESQRRFSRLA
jgi:hypothetical protein